MRRMCENRISAGKVGGRGGAPEELLESATSARSVRVCNESGTPCPLGVTASAADPYENSCWWILRCLLVLRVL